VIRDGLLAPTESPSREEIDLIRDYLEHQRPIALAVWVRHEEPDNDPRHHDHHLILGMRDEDYEARDVAAVERGVTGEAALPGWVDLARRSQVEGLRERGLVLWERSGEAPAGLDPLAFSFTWEPAFGSDERLGAFRRLLAAVPPVVRVEATHERLCKDGRAVDGTTGMYVGYDERRGRIDDLIHRVQSAWRGSGLPWPANRSITLGLPRDPRVATALLFEAPR